jgi:predicted small metal-binding protein
MAKILHCSEIIPGCTFVATGKTPEEVFEHASEHVRLVHKFRSVSPEVIAVIRGTALEENPDRPARAHMRHGAANKPLRALVTKRST